jgi:hypothetical protein
MTLKIQISNGKSSIVEEGLYSFYLCFVRKLKEASFFCFSSTIDDLTLLVLPLCNVFSEVNRQATTYDVKILSRFHMLAYFLRIYQQIWKLEKEDVKVLVYLKISRNTMKAFYNFFYLTCA